MKKLLSVVGVALWVSGVGIAAAQQPLEADVDKSVLPVLVAVDASGTVTKIDPAIELFPAQDQLLERAVKQLITGPATDPNGRKVSSQMVLRFSMQPVPGAAGAYEFAYLDAMPVQLESLHWVNTKKGFALAPDQGAGQGKGSNRWQTEMARQMSLRPRSMKPMVHHTPDNYPNPADDP